MLQGMKRRKKKKMEDAFDRTTFNARISYPVTLKRNIEPLAAHSRHVSQQNSINFRRSSISREHRIVD